MKQNWLRAHNCSLDLSRQSYKSQASLCTSPSQWLRMTETKRPFPVSSRNSPMGSFGLRNFHQPGKTFLLLDNKVCISHTIIFPYPFHLLHRHQALQSEGSLSLFFLCSLIFYPSQIFSHIFWKLNPIFTFASQTIQTNTKALYTSKEIISGIKNRSVKIFQSKKQKWLKRKKNRVGQWPKRSNQMAQQTYNWNVRRGEAENILRANDWTTF